MSLSCRACVVLAGLPLSAVLGMLAADAVNAEQSRQPTTAPSVVTPSGNRDRTVNAFASNRFGRSTPLPKAPGAIRLATYNTMNLFDSVDDPSLQGEFDDIKTPTSPQRCAELATVITAIDADIIALQEVESIEALRWFRDTFLRHAGYNHLESKDVGYYRGVECSVMSRFPIVNSRVWPNDSLDHVQRSGIGWAPKPRNAGKLSYQRSPLMVEIAVSDTYTLTVFSEHHKAGSSEFKHHREAEALRNLELIAELQKNDPSRNIVIMGDFNAAPWDKSLRAYLHAGMVDALSYRTTGKDDVESPLYKTHESDRVLDYILLNSAAYREYVPGSGFVYGTMYPPESYDWQRDPPPPGYASDHYPVVIDLIPRNAP